MRESHVTFWELIPGRGNWEYKALGWKDSWPALGGAGGGSAGQEESAPEDVKEGVEEAFPAAARPVGSGKAIGRFEQGTSMIQPSAAQCWVQGLC